MKVELPSKRTLSIGEVTPYWRNPRKIPQEAVEAVRRSLEGYSYLQPIVVDEGNVIVVGHTRFAAMKELGVTEVECYVTDLPEEKVREYRVLDNRLSEMTEWNHESLVAELREVEDDTLAAYFPDVDLEVGALDDVEVTEDDVEEATRKINEVQEPQQHPTTVVVCPSCAGEFKVRTDSIMSVSDDGGSV